MNAITLFYIFFSITMVKCGDVRSTQQQKAHMTAQIEHLLNQMPKDTKVPILDRIKYAVHVYNKLVKENELKKKQLMALKKKEEERMRLEKEKKIYEQFLAQKAQNHPFLKDFSTNRW